MALLYKQLSPLHGVWKMEESSDELLGMLEHKADYSSFLERVSAEKRRQERFASRMLLKELLGEEARVDYHSTGAPFLACVPLYISISHTKDYVAVILDKRPRDRYRVSFGPDLENTKSLYESGGRGGYRSGA